jgi:hypothetical protein
MASNHQLKASDRVHLREIEIGMRNLRSVGGCVLPEPFIYLWLRPLLQLEVLRRSATRSFDEE